MITPRISWGTITADGKIVNSSGDFMVTNIDNGRYTVSFNDHFSSVPAIVGSQNNFGSDSEWNTDGVVFPFVNTNSFQVNTGTGGGGGDLQNRSFAFIAIGF